jgi:hypothetical protein
VETFLGDSHLLADVIYHLRQTHDSQRLVQKFSLGRGDSDDLLSLARTIRETEKILARLKEQYHPSLDHIVARIVIPEKLCERIERAIDEEGLVERQRLEELEIAKMGKIVRRIEGREVEGDKIGKKKEQLKQEDVWIMKKTLTPSISSLIQGRVQHCSDFITCSKNCLMIRRIYKSVYLRNLVTPPQTAHNNFRRQIAESSLDPRPGSYCSRQFKRR